MWVELGYAYNGYTFVFVCMSKFEMLTMVPVDLDLVDVQYLNYKDIEQLNNYNKQVYNVLSPYMKGEELEQLVYSTREL